MIAGAVLILVIFWIAALFGVFRGEERRRLSAAEQWQAAANELGLSLTRPKRQDLRLQGMLQGVPVQADLKYQQQGKIKVRYLRLRVGHGSSIPKHLAVHSDSLLRSVSRMVSAERDEQLGDPDFDEQVELPTLDASSCAALSLGARTQLLRLIKLGGGLQEGVLVLERLWNDEEEPTWLPRMLVWLAKLGRLLSVPPDALHQRLVDNASKDPSPGVRLQNLHFLAAPSTSTPPALLASVGCSLLGDVNPNVRLLAAPLVGEEGQRVLGALAADATLTTALRVRAVTALAEGPAPSIALVRGLFTETQPPELVCAALAVVGQQSLSPLADVATECTRSAREIVRAAAASSLGRLAHPGVANPQVEAVLIALLSDVSADVQHASADALGVFGSVAAVEPLLPLAEGFGRSQLRQAARGAIGRIQSRLGNVEAGRVSLAHDHELAGAVDLADTAATRVGDLSLAEDAASEPETAETGGPALSVERRG